MQWIHDFDLFMFDFDGLLVNTEELHFLAYQKMCENRGFELPWDFPQYCRTAHYESDNIKKMIYRDLPKLYEQEPNWDILYAEKKKIMVNLLKEGAIHLMPGAEILLRALDEANIPRCVVTNSPDDQVAFSKEQNPILKTIPHWFTRETYSHPKPHPECYLNAIKKMGGKRIIGFEDTPRGLQALMHTPAKPVMITPIDYPEIPQLVARGVLHFPTFLSLQKL